MPNKPNRCLKKLAADLAIKQVMLTHTREHIRHLRDIYSTVNDAQLDIDTRGLKKTIKRCEMFSTRLRENIDRCAEVFVVDKPECPRCGSENIEWWPAEPGTSMMQYHCKCCGWEKIKIRNLDEGE